MERRKRHARLEVAGAAAYELGIRDTEHGVPLQPYPEGCPAGPADDG